MLWHGLCVPSFPRTWPLQANKKTFVSQLAKVERREALSIPGAQRSRRARKRARREFGVWAAQSLTSITDLLRLVSLHFFLIAAFLISGAAVLASASDSNPSTAENLRPTA